MKNRDYKEFAPGEYYHIFNRGNGKMDIFRDEQDFLNFLKRLKHILCLTRMTLAEEQGSSLLRLKPLPSDSFSVVCYCLMPNHFHILIRQNTDVSISKLVSKLCTSYSMYFNKKHKHTGGLFQDQFKAVLVESNKQLLWLSAYIHQNPKVAGLVTHIKDWQWGSFSDYTSARKGEMCDKGIILEQFKSNKDYINFVNDSFTIIKEQKEMNDLLLD